MAAAAYRRITIDFAIGPQTLFFRFLNIAIPTIEKRLEGAY